MLTHKDCCTLYEIPEERDILTRKLFDVNMRLFRYNPDYRSIVQCAIEHIRECAMTQREGYKKPHGYSGANAGIPWNIIALADGTVMINPVVVKVDPRKRESFSNCGSLLLKEPIKIWRHSRVVVDYFDRDGAPCQAEGYLPTVQHEIDHNNGILIWDYLPGSEAYPLKGER